MFDTLRIWIRFYGSYDVERLRVKGANHETSFMMYLRIPFIKIAIYSIVIRLSSTENSQITLLSLLISGRLTPIIVS